MTEEEAMAYLKPRLRIFIQCTNDNIALNKAMSALEKQIPKKPIGLGIGFGGCPSCHWALVKSPYYCPACGQRIDWSGK